MASLFERQHVAPKRVMKFYAHHFLKRIAHFYVKMATAEGGWEVYISLVGKRPGIYKVADNTFFGGKVFNHL